VALVRQLATRALGTCEEDDREEWNQFKIWKTRFLDKTNDFKEDSMEWMHSE